MGCGSSLISDPSKSREPWKDFSKHPVHQRYKVGHKIGAGAFSQVHVGTCNRKGEDVAIKIVFKERPGLKKDNISILRNEVAVLRALNHKCIICFKGMTEDDHQIAMVLEKVDGPEMAEHLKKVRYYSEKQAAYMFYQVVSGVAHMHSQGYVHRDMKPENILLVEKPSKDPNEKLHIKLIDMGMGIKLEEGKRTKGIMGTAGYMAPECRDMQPHTYAMDIWSLGIILFQMLRGKLPYTQAQIQKYLYTSIDVASTQLYTSREGKQEPFTREVDELLKSMIKIDPKKRPTAMQVLEHPWFQKMMPTGRSRFSVDGVGR